LYFFALLSNKYCAKVSLCGLNSLKSAISSQQKKQSYAFGFYEKSSIFAAEFSETSRIIVLTLHPKIRNK